ncbi:hypothetical protein GCM10017691_47580 [Pseudonocardia petroleophila]|uniref:PqqD family protein n=1 Tax=Pseudonocardia petroleophila TaxID=37331 RepID=A0A7G7MQJ2_9PSEU|nr:PqqD family protein [Pseudonocardia petroleophila]QNG55053.1 PqqD family protein [Pseudonocardia petroleophila]
MQVRTADLSARTIGDETIVLSLPTSRYFTITGVGTRLFELLGRETTVEEMVTTIVAEYEVDTATARRDVEGFVARLRDAQLLA